MKYGEKFERESAPQWSLHNIDYNSLKHHIKVNTTKDQAMAIAIPGQQDSPLRRFEDGFYDELCRQHDRVDLFVSSKTDEIARRLQHLSNQIQRLLIRCAGSGREGHMSLKRQRRFVKYENELLQCGDEIQSLQRFVGAQVVAFRKILKKYRKWTGSSTLGSRFRGAVLSHPKSFTKRDFSQLQTQCDNLLAVLRAALPAESRGTASPADSISTIPSLRDAPLPSDTVAQPATQQQLGYWNEYDHGSEAGDADPYRDSGYAIYIHPDEDTGFPGLATLTALIKTPIDTMNKWMSNGRRGVGDEEQGPLLQGGGTTYGSVNSGYFTHPPGVSMSDTEVEDDTQPSLASRRTSNGYASSEEFPLGYKTYYAAVPSIREQHLIRYREWLLFWGTWACFAASFALMGIAALLIKTGRHRMRLEVDAGVTLGIMASLGSACAGLGMTLARQDQLGWVNVLSVWATFVAACILNGILLVLVVGDAPL